MYLLGGRLERVDRLGVATGSVGALAVGVEAVACSGEEGVGAFLAASAYVIGGCVSLRDSSRAGSSGVTGTSWAGLLGHAGASQV